MQKFNAKNRKYAVSSLFQAGKTMNFVVPFPNFKFLYILEPMFMHPPMIISHSGWRGIFSASGDEEDKTEEIKKEHRVICAGAASVFADYLFKLQESKKPLVLIGSDTRPTGKAIADVIISALQDCGCEIRYAGFTAAPEIMAWARSLGLKNIHCGFIYISASHNPIGHNGFKFGLNDGAVLQTQESAKLISNFRSLMSRPDIISYMEEILTASSFSSESVQENKKEAMDAYLSFCTEVVFGEHSAKLIETALREGLAQEKIGVCCDFNGSARCASIDRKFFLDFGIEFDAFNTQPGKIAHKIIPEGDALQPCCSFLEELHSRNESFILGYVPDCDGDRGNLVIWDETLQKARPLEAQEVFALACIAELAQLAWAGCTSDMALVVNDATSLRIDRIAETFGASVYRAEVGEANVVALARKLRGEGKTVRILGEGSNGGNITHPSSVRDPLHTVLAIVKLLRIRTKNGKAGFYEIWLNFSGKAGQYNDNFTLADILESMPPFVTTSSYSAQALLNLPLKNYKVFNERYEKIFLEEWNSRKNLLETNFGISGWEASAYNGIIESRGIKNFASAGQGGLKICFLDINRKPVAAIWMRPSATEPVFRIMADAEGDDRQFEQYLIEWQRGMADEAGRN